MMRCIAAGESINTPAGVRNDASPAVSVISGDYSGMNEAIKGLQTEYVVFLEKGASLCDNALSRLLKSVRGVGMAFCGYESPSEESPETVRRVLSSPDMACRLFFRLHDESMVSNKLFRTSIIKKHGLFFEPSFKSECSCAFLASYLMYCKNARFIPERLVRMSDDEGGGFEETAESLKGFSYMRKLFKKKAAFSDALYYCGEYMSDVIFSLYSEMVNDGEENEVLYRNSSFREFARKLPLIVEKPNDKESLYYYKAILRYGFTGRVDYEI